MGGPCPSLVSKLLLRGHLFCSPSCVTIDRLVTMADDERRSSKRSRFDQTEPEVKRTSRFDRRSRSPSNRNADLKRSRSPLTKDKALSPRGEEKKSTGLDPAAAAGEFRAQTHHVHPSVTNSADSCRCCENQRSNPGEKRHTTC